MASQTEGLRAGAGDHGRGRGPAFENTVTEKEIDLERFPAPIWHKLDGGRYIGTGCCVVTKDPESGHINVGTYRCMIQGKNRITVKMDKGKHGRMAQEKYHHGGRSCPVAISLGQDPWLFLASTSPLSLDSCEYEFAGWLRGAPIQVVPGPLTGLPIPATAEIVLEGEIPPYGPAELPKEGPYLGIGGRSAFSDGRLGLSNASWHGRSQAVLSSRWLTPKRKFLSFTGSRMGMLQIPQTEFDGRRADVSLVG